MISVYAFREGMNMKYLTKIYPDRLLHEIKKSRFRSIARFASAVGVSRSWLSSRIHSGYMAPDLLSACCRVLDHVPAYYTEEKPVLFLDPVSRQFEKIPPYSLREEISAGLSVPGSLRNMLLVMGFTPQDAELYSGGWELFAVDLSSFLEWYQRTHKVKKDAAGVHWQ